MALLSILHPLLLVLILYGPAHWELCLLLHLNTPCFYMLLPFSAVTLYPGIGPELNLIKRIKQADIILFKELDPILHSQLRLAVVSLLIAVKEAEFIFLKEKTNSTAGNLSVQINKLKDAGYIEVTKQFKDNYPQTLCRITPKGITAFEEYVNALKEYMDPGRL